jgi:uncharacterized protein (DUF58 family)
MNVFPHTRLLAALATLCGLAVPVVLVPGLEPIWLATVVMVAALAIWDAFLLRRAPSLEAERRLPDRLFVGRSADIVVALRNPGSTPVSVDVHEDLPLGLAAENPEYRDVPVDPGAVTTLRYAVTPTRRGNAACGPLLLMQCSPLGLLRRRLLAAAGDVVRVYPDVSRLLRPQTLDPKAILNSLGVRPRRQRGEGMELESLRDYVPGDDPRRIHWAASARRGRPVTRLTQRERHRNLLIAIDASRLMATRVGERTKLDFAADAALVLAYGGLLAGDRVGMLAFDDRVRGLLSPRAHRRELGHFVDLVRELEPRLTEPDFGALTTTLATRQRQHALVVVLTDFVDVDAASLLVPLTALGRRHRLLLVALRDPIFADLDSDRGADDLGLYRRLVLDDLLREREQALLSLRRRGVQTLDLPPPQITAAVLNRYLQMRASE